MRPTSLALAVVVLASGCLGQGAPADGPDRTSRGALDGDGNATAWTSLFLERRGQPSDWWIAWQPIQPTTELQYEYDWGFEAMTPASGQASGFFAPPMVVIDRGNDIALTGVFATPEFFTLEAGGPGFTASRTGGVGLAVGGGEIVGFVAAAASASPWSYRLEITVSGGNGSVVKRAHYDGSGTGTIAAYEPGTLEGRENPLVGTARVAATIPGLGWTHVQAEFDPLQPIGARLYDVALPGGFTYAGHGYGYGYDAGIRGSSTRSSKFDYFGTFADEGGPAHLEITYAEATTAFGVGLVHIPVDDLPDVFSGPYQGFGDPFGDGPLGASAHRRFWATERLS